LTPLLLSHRIIYMRTTTTVEGTHMNRIGPSQRAVAAYVEANPGCPKLHPAEHVGPHGSRKYGYDAVNRAIRAGLIEDRGTKTYQLYLTAKGAVLLGIDDFAG
jgi:hypothetical protein